MLTDEHHVCKIVYSSHSSGEGPHLNCGCTRELGTRSLKIRHAELHLSIICRGDNSEHRHIRKFSKLAHNLGIKRLSIKIHVKQFAQIYSRRWWENPGQITTDIRNALNCFGPLGVLTDGLSIEVELPTNEPNLT